MQNFWGLNTRKIAYAALLIALNIVFVRLLAISSGSLRINFGFVPLAIAGMLFNPLLCGVFAAVADILGYFLFPVGGFYLPGLTAAAFLYGALFGLFYYKRKMTLKNIVVSNAVCIISVELCLKALVLSALYTWEALLITRPVQSAVMLAVQIPSVYLINKYFIEKNKTLLGIG